MAEDPPRRRMVRQPTRGDDAARAAPARLKTAKGRTLAQQQWLERQINDPFAAQARASGYRSRAAYKLIEIDDKLRLLAPGRRVVDLGCAPGGWLQVAQQRGVRALAGIDLLPVEPVAGAVLLQGDFTDPANVRALLAQLGGTPDLILSDMAPNTTGHRETDHLRIVGLIEAAVEFALAVLPPGGALLAKAFQGGETAELIGRLKRHFARVAILKPKASRAESSEVYLAATAFKGAILPRERPSAGDQPIS